MFAEEDGVFFEVVDFEAEDFEGFFDGFGAAFVEAGVDVFEAHFFKK